MIELFGNIVTVFGRILNIMETNFERELRNSRKAGLRCVGAFSRTKRNRVRNGQRLKSPAVIVRKQKGSRMETAKEMFTLRACLPGNGPVVDLVMHATSRSISETEKKRSQVSCHQRSA